MSLVEVLISIVSSIFLVVFMIVIIGKFLDRR